MKQFIIDEWGTVHMASIIFFGFSINGVAALHTEILKNNELNHFYEIYLKFSNINGITFRRWLMASNPSLTNFIDEHWDKMA